MFKIEIRTICKMCPNKITNKRSRTYCSATCRNKFFNTKFRDDHTEWQRKRRAEIAKIPSKKKVQCLICKGWYVQVCTHTLQVHGVGGREYRENFNLEVKRGVVPAWYREMKGEQCIENETFQNLKAGAKFRFKKGQSGVGVYKRSPITLERLSALGKSRIYKNNRRNQNEKNNQKKVLSK